MNATKWSWIDNSPFDFNEWKKGEPQNITGLGCISVSINAGTWSSQDCFKKKPYVCDVTPKPTMPPFVKCPWGWAYYEPTGSCYGVNYTVPVGKLSWTAAEQYCEQYGAHLASVHSYDELSFLNS
uniref:C-type lectin domain-containing protein n=1 Tax=Panagrolaimus davidi TaxID=227884 RepID=A0A914P8Z6_9BILA